MRLSKPAVFLSPLVVLGCAGGPAHQPSHTPAASPTVLPMWVENAGTFPGYSLSEYMIGVGTAKVDGDRGTAKDMALQSGRKRISEELNSDLQGVTDTYLREFASGDEYLSTSEYVSEVRAKTESLLLGSKAVEEFFDPLSDTLYALVVLNREQHATALLERIDADLARASAAAEQSSSTGKLRALIDEHVILEKTMPSILNLEIALPRGHPTRAELEKRSTVVKGRLKAVLKDYNDLGVAVRTVEGSGQRGYPTEALAEEIVFEATAGGGPLVGFPVTFSLEHPEKAEILNGSGQTGSDGRFSCRVGGLTLTGDEENGVHATLDYASLGEGILRAADASAFFVLPTLHTATFSILIEEINEEVSKDTALPESAVRGALKEGLTAREARVIDLDKFLSSAEMEKALDESPAWLAEHLGGKVDYLIRGTARSRFSSITRNRPFCYAGGKIEMIDIRTGVQSRPYESALTSTGIKATGSDKVDAGNQALRKFAAAVETEYMGRIDEVFRAQ